MKSDSMHKTYVIEAFQVDPLTRLAFAPHPYAEIMSSYFPHHGIEKYGPYSKDEITKVRILNISPKNYDIAFAERGKKLIMRVKQCLESYTMFRVPVVSLDFIELPIDSYIDELNRLMAREKGYDVLTVGLPKGNFPAGYVERLYYAIKALSLKHGVPTQVYTEKLFNAIEYEPVMPGLFNLTLNIYAKCGGIPWALYDKIKDADIVIGLGWAFKRENPEERIGKIRKCFSYVHTFNEYGIWCSFFSTIVDVDKYLDGIVNLIQESINRYEGSTGRPPKNLVIHTPKRFRFEEIEKIVQEAKKYDVMMLVLHISDDVPARVYDLSFKYFACPRGLCSLFDERIAFISTTGAYGEKVEMGTPRLVKVEVLYPRIKDVKVLSSACNHVYALSTLNWRTMKRVRLPCSIHYSKLIADFIKYFDSMKDVKELFKDVGNIYKPHPRLEDKLWFI